MKKQAQGTSRDSSGRPQFRATTWSKKGKGKDPKQNRRQAKMNIRNG
tara:strand:+ start:480 stop:620 length:141 start_codon:yes stop_codon:yes gene_type:complete